MALIKCTECGKEISDKAPTCPSCGAPQLKRPICQECGTENQLGSSVCRVCNHILDTHATSNSNGCPKCGIPYITEQKDAKFSAVFLISVPLFLIGVGVLLFNWIGGIAVIGLAFIIDYIFRKKKTILICPKCRFEPY